MDKTINDRLVSTINRFDKLVYAKPLMNKQLINKYQSIYDEADELLDMMNESDDDEFIIVQSIYLIEELNEFVELVKRYVSNSFSKKRKRIIKNN
jgi:hypothetical protein